MLTAQVYNVTHEEFNTQLGSVGFRFKPRAFTDVPVMDFKIGMEDIPQFFEREYGHRGLFFVDPEKDFKELERKALLRYLDTVNLSIRDHISMMNDYKGQGVTLEEPARLKKLRVWKSEIEAMLNLISPIDAIPSFFDDETRDRLGLNTPSSVKIEDKPKRGRPFSKEKEASLSPQE